MGLLIATVYPWIKGLHVFSVIVWMSAQITLPFVLSFHQRVPVDSEQARLFAKLERLLVRYLLNPGIVAAFVFGSLMAYVVVDTNGHWPVWLRLKVFLAILLSAMHGLLVRQIKRVSVGSVEWRGGRWKRVLLLDFALLLAVVVLAVMKPA